MGLQNGGGGLRIFLHLAQFFLSALTIVGLHATGSLWDYDQYRKRDLVKPSGSGSRGRQHRTPSPYRGPGGASKIEDEYVTYFSGALWGGVVGVLGIGALGVFLLSWIIPLPKTTLPKMLMTVYYLACACLVIIVSSVGLGWNPGIVNYNKCMKDLADQLKILEEAKVDLKDRYYTQTACVPYLDIFPRFVVYLISCLHAAVYLASSYVSFTDKTSSPYQSLRINPAQPVMTPNPEYQMSAQNSEMQENPDQIPA